jgi:putative DNA primase/helicase
VARLRGVRLAAGSEVAEGSRWDEPLVKTLTGGDRIVARHLHQEPIEFDPTWKLILAVNHKPPVRGTDDGIWRRIHLLPFTKQFQHGTQDRELPAKLQSEHAGILALLVQGCLAWQRDGLALPRSMVAATSEYRVEHDTIGSFLAEATRQKYGAASNKSAMYRTYRAWATEAGEHVFGRSIFVRMLRERRIEENATQWLDIEIMAGF